MKGNMRGLSNVTNAFIRFWVQLFYWEQSAISVIEQEGVYDDPTMSTDGWEQCKILRSVDMPAFLHLQYIAEKSHQVQIIREGNSVETFCLNIRNKDCSKYINNMFSRTKRALR